MDCFIAIRRTSAAKGALFTSSVGATAAFGVFDSAGGAALATLAAGGAVSIYLVNGTALNGGAAGVTQVQLDTALTPGNWFVLEIRNLDLSTWTNAQLSQLALYFVNGHEGGVILAPAGSAALRSQNRAWLGAKVGLVL